MAWLFFGCQKQPLENPCLAFDLGRFQLKQVVTGEGSLWDCQATYQDNFKQQAKVQMQKAKEMDQGPGWLPYQFEKQFVYYKDAFPGIRVAWPHQNGSIELFLEGVSRPQGPVLRAYLFEYRSQVRFEKIELEKQVEQIKSAAKIRPEASQTHLELARKQRLLGNLRMEGLELHVAAEMDPGCFDCFFEMGCLYAHLKQWDLALKALRKAQSIRPEAWEPWFRSGEVLRGIKDKTGAQTAYQEALSRADCQKDKQAILKILEKLKQIQENPSPIRKP